MMHHLSFPAALLALFFVGISACSSQPTGLKKITIPEVLPLIDAQGSALQIVDLRTPGEVAATGTLPGAQMMNFRDAGFAENIKKLDKKRPVLLYCAAGSRSAQAAEMLQKQGFEAVYDMTPGMDGWLAAGQQTVK